MGPFASRLVDAGRVDRRAPRLALPFAAMAGEERFMRARQAAERCRTLLLEHGADVITEPDQATLISWRADDPRPWSTGSRAGRCRP